MACVLRATLIASLSCGIMFSFQFEACVKWPNYGVRDQNSCRVDLINNDHFEPFLFEDAVEYCKQSGGIVDRSFLNRSYRALLDVLLMTRAGRFSGVNEKMWISQRGLLSDHDCSESYTSRPGCEVLCLFKSCPLGKFGFPECRSTCRCDDGSRCDISTGACLETWCTPGFYGPPFCRKCNCHKGTQCDTETGECLLGCKKGWGGMSCQQWKCRSRKCPAFARFSRNSECDMGWTGVECKTRLCPEGSYGVPDCNKTCYCQEKQYCNAVDGSCGGNPCVTGRVGPRCVDLAVNFTCPPFRYGQAGCGSFCFCYKNVPCTVTSGLCPGICIPGWTGPHCNVRVCPRGYYSYPECTELCKCAVVEGCNALTGACELELCELWRNCTSLKSTYDFEKAHPIVWYLVITIVVFVVATVLLLIALCIEKEPSEIFTEH